MLVNCLAELSPDNSEPLSMYRATDSEPAACKALPRQLIGQLVKGGAVPPLLRLRGLGYPRCVPDPAPDWIFSSVSADCHWCVASGTHEGSEASHCCLAAETCVVASLCHLIPMVAGRQLVLRRTSKMNLLD